MSFLCSHVYQQNYCQIVFQVIVLSTHIPFLQQYMEKDLIQPLLWPLNTTYPLIFHQYIYFFASKENRNTFMQNPLKYLRQPKPTPSLPIKMAVVGPPKSGKTTGETQDRNLSSQLFLWHFLNAFFSIFSFTNYHHFSHFASPVAQMFAQKYGLARLSIGSVLRTVLNTQEHTHLAVQMKKYLSQGLIVPDELAIQCLEVELMNSVCSTRG